MSKTYNLIKFLLLLMITISLFLLISCETIYNYDLSIKGIDSLPATKSCLKKYIPTSVDAIAGKQKKEINKIIFELDSHKTEILDSLERDSVKTDTGIILKFTIVAIDPYDEISEFPVEKIYQR